MIRPRLSGLALAAVATLAAALPAQAQSSAVLDELREEIRKLRAEVEALKKGAAAARPADTSGWGERVEALELRQKDAVVMGDVPGSFRIPGSETSVKLYGFAEAHLVHDRQGSAPGDLFTNLLEQPLDGRDAGFHRGTTRLTAQTSRFGFETATPTAQGTFATRLEMDFYAYCGTECHRNRLRLRHAYGEYSGWLIGQTWSTFMDLDNLPETVDFNGPIGAPFSRRTMVRYTYHDPRLAKFTVALEDPEDGARVPNLVARIDKGFDGGNVNLRLLSHEKRVGTETRRGSGFGLGGGYKLDDRNLLMAQVAHVSGDYDMMYGSFGYGLDGTGRILFDRTDGLVAGWSHLYSPQLRAHLVLGTMRSRGDAVFDNRRLTQLHVGAIYAPIRNVELGAEYIHGTRRTFDGDTGTMSRFDLMARYLF